MALTRDCFVRITNLLTPFMQDESMRQVVLQPALYDTPLLNQIVFSGNAQAFTTMLVSKLDTFGRVTEDKTAVSAVLEALQGHVGWDKQAEIAKLIDCANASLPVALPVTKPLLPSPTNHAARDHLFISYSSADRVSFVDRLARDLTDAGHSVWVDNLDEKYGGIIGGKLWQQELANALNRCTMVIFVVTPDSVKSGWVQAELIRAGEMDKPVIPVIARPLSPEAIQQEFMQIRIGDKTIADMHYRDFTQTGYEAGLASLLRDINNQLSTTTD